VKRLFPWLLACGAAFAAAPARGQGVTVALVPATLEVSPGASFELELRVTQAGSAFNGFDAVIGFDPAALTLQPLAPVGLQVGTLMSGACGSTFHLFTPSASSASITDVLLCSNQSVMGPGQIYRLRFVAANTPQVTDVVFLPGLQFYADGLFVHPASSSNARIGIGMSPVGAEPAPLRSGLRLGIAPNPARGGTRFTLEADRPGTRHVRLLDLKGRVVRRFDRPAAEPGALALQWDGRDSWGRALSPGVYVVQFEVEGRSVSSRLAIVR
jgi:hypothetical protein